MHTRSLYAISEKFCAIRHTEDLAATLFCNLHQITLSANFPNYRTFSIPKKDGSLRLIEDPEQELKKILSDLNEMLQAVLFKYRNPFMYGFLVNADDDVRPRHIVSNAAAHDDGLFLLNIDLKDFFHHVSWSKVKGIFETQPFRFEEEVATLLANLCTYNGRLPMGSPTSPALSNFAAMPLDESLGLYAQSKGWVYTRYADDLSFSAQKPIFESETKEIIGIIANHGFVVNPNKVKIMGEKDEKIVTGILIQKGKVGIPPAYLAQLKTEIEHLAYTVLLGIRYKGAVPKWVKDYCKQIDGKIAFVNMVIGEHHTTYIQLMRQYKKALHPPDEDFAVLDWLDFPY
jgi:RNA-directed DNA polymerase